MVVMTIQVNILGLYQEDGLDEGIYITSEDVFIKIAREYHPFISTGDLNEMFACLKDCAPRKQKCKAKKLDCRKQWNL